MSDEQNAVILVVPKYVYIHVLSMTAGEMLEQLLVEGELSGRTCTHCARYAAIRWAHENRRRNVNRDPHEPRVLVGRPGQPVGPEAA